jgi:hypothetical protein
MKDLFCGGAKTSSKLKGIKGYVFDFGNNLLLFLKKVLKYLTGLNEKNHRRELNI